MKSAFNNGIGDPSQEVKDFFTNNAGKTSEEMLRIAKSSDLASASMQKFLLSKKEAYAIKDLETYIKFMKVKNGVLDIQAVKLKAVAMARNLLVDVGIGLAMWGISKIVDSVVNAQERAIEAADKVVSKYNTQNSKLKENKSTIDSISNDYARLSKGVDNLGRNVSLTADEYANYNSITNKIADMFPEMVQGYTDEGNAIIKNKGNVEELTKAYKAQKDAAEDAIITSASTVFKGVKAESDKDPNFVWEDTGTKQLLELAKKIRNTGGDKDKIDKFISSFKENTYSAKNWMDLFSRANLKIGFGFRNLNNADYISKNYDQFKSVVSVLERELDAQTSKLKPIVNTYMNRLLASSDLDDNTKDIIRQFIGNVSSEFWLSFDDDVDMNKWIAEITQKFQELDKLSEGGNVKLTVRPVIDASELNDKGWNAGDGQATVYTSTYSNGDFDDLKPKSEKDTIAINFTPIIVDPKTGEVKGILTPEELEKYAHDVIAGVHTDYNNLQIGGEFTGKNAIDDAEKAADKIHGLHDNLFVDNKAIGSWNNVYSSIFNIGTAANESSKEVSKVTSALSDLASAVDNISKLSTAFKEVREDGYVSIKTLKEIQEATKLSGDEWEEYKSKLLNAKVGSAEFKETLSELTYKMLDAVYSGVDLTDTTEKEITAMLRENNVSNASAVAAEYLAKAKAKAKIASLDFANNTGATIQTLLNEASAMGLTEAQMYELIIAHIQFNDTTLDASQKVEALKQVMIAAGLAADAVNSVFSVSSKSSWGDKKAWMAANGVTTMDDAKGRTGKTADGKTYKYLDYVYKGVRYDTVEEVESIIAKEKVTERQGQANWEMPTYTDPSADKQDKENADKAAEDAKKQAEEAEQARIDALKEGISKREAILEKYKEKIDIIDWGIELSDYNDLVTKSDLLSNKMTQLTLYGADLKNQFEAISNIVPQTAEEADALATTLGNLGDKMRSNITDIRKTQVEIQKLSIDAIVSAGTDKLKALENSLSDIENRMDILSKDNKDDYKYVREMLSLDVLLPSSSSTKAVAARRRENRALLSEQESYHNSVTEMEEAEILKNEKLREDERQAIIQSLVEIKDNTQLKMSEVSDDYTAFLAKNETDTSKSSQNIADIIDSTDVEFPTPTINMNPVDTAVQNSIEKFKDFKDVIGEINEDAKTLADNLKLINDETGGATGSSSGKGGGENGTSSGKGGDDSPLDDYKDKISEYLQSRGGESYNGEVSDSGYGDPFPPGIPQTSPFGYRKHPKTGQIKFHSGIDLGAPGGTKIYSVSDGVVIQSGWSNGYGNSVQIKDAHGKTWLYGHMLQPSGLKVGSKISRGQIVGLVGSTGMSTGNHLHLELRNTDGTTINPSPYLPNYARGTGGHPGGMALVGDDIAGRLNSIRPEMVIRKRGGVSIVGTHGAEFVNLESGDQVIPYEKTREILSRSGIKGFDIPRFATGTPTSNPDYQKEINAAADAFGIPREILYAIIDHESGNGTHPNTWGYSNWSQDYGLMQINRQGSINDLTRPGFAAGAKALSILAANGVDYTKAIGAGSAYYRDHIWTGAATLYKNRYGYNAQSWEDALHYYASGSLTGGGQAVAEFMQLANSAAFKNMSKSTAAGSDTEKIAADLAQNDLEKLQTAREQLYRKYVEYIKNNAGNYDQAVVDKYESDLKSADSKILSLKTVNEKQGFIDSVVQKVAEISHAVAVDVLKQERSVDSMAATDDEKSMEKARRYFYSYSYGSDEAGKILSDAYKALAAEYINYTANTPLNEQSQEVIDAYVDGLQEIKDKAMEVADGVQSARDSVVSLIEDYTSKIDDYISERNTYNDWSRYGDSEFAAVKRQRDKFASNKDILGEEETARRVSEYNQKLYGMGKDAINDSIEKLISKEEKYQSKVKEGLDLWIKQIDAMKSLTQTHFDVINSIADAQHDIAKELQSSMTMSEYLDEKTRKLLFNMDDYNALNEELNDINAEALKLQRDFNQELAFASDDEIPKITSHYEMQYKLLTKNYEIKKAELEVEKKRQQLDNALRERKVRMFINGRWQYVASTQDVINAQNEYSDAQYNASKARTSLDQQKQINSLQSKSDSFTYESSKIDSDLQKFRDKWNEIQDQINGEAKDFKDVLADIVYSGVPQLDELLGSCGIAISDFTEEITGKKISYIKNVDYLAAIWEETDLNKALRYNDARNKKIDDARVTDAAYGQRKLTAAEVTAMVSANIQAKAKAVGAGAVMDGFLDYVTKTPTDEIDNRVVDSYIDQIKNRTGGNDSVNLANITQLNIGGGSDISTLPIKPGDMDLSNMMPMSSFAFPNGMPEVSVSQDYSQNTDQSIHIGNITVEAQNPNGKQLAEAIQRITPNHG